MNYTKNIITPDIEIANIVLEHPKLLLFLEHFEASLPLQDKTISTICAERNIRPGLFIALLNLYIGTDYAPPGDLILTDLPAIITYLQNSHRYYLDEIYPAIRQDIQMLYELNDSPEIKMADDFFQNYFKEVVEHLRYENEVVFPYINGLTAQIRHDKSVEKLKAASYSVVEYQEHHDDIEEKLDDLVQLLIRYLPLKEDGKARRKLFSRLTELNYDLKIHSLIEEWILIPLVQKLELKIKE